jgi:hypothetical protein
MGALTDLWRSERGLLAVLIILAASVLAGLGSMPVAEWQTFVTGIFVSYAAGKTVTGAVEILKGKPADSAPKAEDAKVDAQP